MARPRGARDRLRERFGEPAYAAGVTGAGRAVFRAGGNGEHVAPRPESVAGYRRQREGALALRARQQARRTRPAEAPETPAQVLARTLGIDEDAAYLAVRHPGLREFISSELRHRRRLTEIDRMQTGRMEVTRHRGRTARELLGERLGFGREGLQVTTKIKAAERAGLEKWHRQQLARSAKERASEEKIATERTEAAAASVVGKRAETRRIAEEKGEQEKLEREYKRQSEWREGIEKRLHKLQDLVAGQGEKGIAADKRHLEEVRKELSAFDKKGELEKAWSALQAGKPSGAAAPAKAEPEPAEAPTTQPAAAPEAAAGPQYQTSAEAIAAIKAGELDLNAPGGEEVFMSLPPQVQQEVRSWLRKNGYLD